MDEFVGSTRVEKIKGVNAKRLVKKGEKARILYVDFHEDCQSLIKNIALRNNWEITSAPDGIEGLKLLEKNLDSLSAVFLEPKHSKVEKIQLIRTFREKTKTSELHLPIVVISAFAMLDQKHSFLAAGADFYFPKPLNGKDLKALINELVFM